MAPKKLFKKVPKKRMFLKRMFSTIFDYATSIFLNGLFTLLPITLTVSVLNISFKLLKSWLIPIHDLQPEIFQRLPHSEILLALVIIFLIGTILKVMIVRSVINGFEWLLIKIPLVRPLYTGVKQLVSAFSSQDKSSFQQVILVEFPRKGVYSLGFMTSEHPEDLSPVKDQLFVNVFVPTTPNPTSGFFIIVPQHEITLIDLTRQEAMALIISGGIIQPDRFAKKEQEFPPLH